MVKQRALMFLSCAVNHFIMIKNKKKVLAMTTVWQDAPGHTTAVTIKKQSSRQTFWLVGHMDSTMWRRDWSRSRWIEWLVTTPQEKNDDLGSFENKIITKHVSKAWQYFPLYWNELKLFYDLLTINTICWILLYRMKRWMDMKSSGS